MGVTGLYTHMASTTDDETQVDDEIESLKSIYGDDVFVFLDTTKRRCVSIDIRSTTTDNETACDQLTVEVTIPSDYPSMSAPVLTFVNCGGLSGEEIKKLRSECESMFNKNEVIVYEWVEKIKEYLLTHKATMTVSHEDNTTTPLPEPQDQSLEERLTPPITGSDEGSGNVMLHGEPFTDRKSTFQAHLAEVHSQAEVERKLQCLKSKRKIEMATHNILAYRFFDVSKKVLIQDFDDDGESAAGGRLLYLLQIMGATNVVVVVSRWYGGIQLGPDRFKHICNVARTLLLDSGLVEKKEIKKGKRKKK